MLKKQVTSSGSQATPSTFLEVLLGETILHRLTAVLEVPDLVTLMSTCRQMRDALVSTGAWWARIKGLMLASEVRLGSRRRCVPLEGLVLQDMTPHQAHDTCAAFDLSMDKAATALGQMWSAVQEYDDEERTRSRDSQRRLSRAMNNFVSRALLLHGHVRQALNILLDLPCPRRLQEWVDFCETNAARDLDTHPIVRGICSDWHKFLDVVQITKSAETTTTLNSHCIRTCNFWLGMPVALEAFRRRQHPLTLLLARWMLEINYSRDPDGTRNAASYPDNVFLGRSARLATAILRILAATDPKQPNEQLCASLDEWITYEMLSQESLEEVSQLHYAILSCLASAVGRAAPGTFLDILLITLSSLLERTEVMPNPEAAAKTTDHFLVDTIHFLASHPRVWASSNIVPHLVPVLGTRGIIHLHRQFLLLCTNYEDAAAAGDIMTTMTRTNDLGLSETWAYHAVKGLKHHMSMLACQPKQRPMFHFLSVEIRAFYERGSI